MHQPKKGKFPVKIVVETLKNVKILTNCPFFGFLCKINLQECRKVTILASLLTAKTLKYAKLVFLYSHRMPLYYGKNTK